MHNRYIFIQANTKSLQLLLVAPNPALLWLGKFNASANEICCMSKSYTTRWIYLTCPTSQFSKTNPRKAYAIPPGMQQRKTIAKLRSTVEGGVILCRTSFSVHVCVYVCACLVWICSQWLPCQGVLPVKQKSKPVCVCVRMSRFTENQAPSKPAQPRNSIHTLSPALAHFHTVLNSDQQTRRHNSLQTYCMLHNVAFFLIF